jgi:solute carrier family 35 protein
MLVEFYFIFAIDFESFPSVQLLAICQLGLTLTGLHIANSFGWVKLPAFSISTVNKIMPLPLFYFGNLLFGLSGTKSLR